MIKKTEQSRQQWRKAALIDYWGLIVGVFQDKLKTRKISELDQKLNWNSSLWEYIHPDSPKRDFLKIAMTKALQPHPTEYTMFSAEEVILITKLL